MTGDLILIYMTCADEAEARKIAAALLDERLIACANIMAPHTALYSWKGKREESREVAVINENPGRSVRPGAGKKPAACTATNAPASSPCLLSAGIRLFLTGSAEKLRLSVGGRAAGVEGIL